MPADGRRFKLILAGLVLVFGLAGFGVAFALGQRGGSDQDRLVTANCDGTCVLLQAEGANPDIVTVTAGSFVEFKSADGKQHNLSLVEHGHGDSGGDHQAGAHEDAGYRSGDFQADEAWRVQFKRDGAFTFVDKYNPKIHVNVVVYTPGKDYKVQ